MARIKIDYGIDLGTTNSALCRMEKGEPKIIKSDTSKDTIPSCVTFTKKKTTKVGDVAYNDMKQAKRCATKTWKASDTTTFIEFKRTIGTDKVYNSSFMSKDYNSEELSAEVLKTLKSFVQDEDVRSVVITVPAKFNSVQKDATVRAARLAGFEHCELLQEPIAASMAYGLSSNQKDGYWLVFDFGGGTFDAALLHLEDGIMQVIDTEGNNYLGGKDLDYAIVDNIMIPVLKEDYAITNILSDENRRQMLRDALKTYAEELKIQLSFKAEESVISNIGELGEDEEGNILELDITLTQEKLKLVFAPIFQKAIDISKELLRKNNLTGAQLNSLILVGGPTYSPILRQMLREQVTDKVRTDIDPMTAVAKGAALYASTKNSEASIEIEKGTITLEVDYQSTSVETMELVTARLDRTKSQGTIPTRLFVEFTRADNAWSSDKIALTEQGDVIECQLVEGRVNNFTVTVYDGQGNNYPCFPTEFSIISGTSVGDAVLSYNWGIEVWDETKKYSVIKLVKGLEKNQHIPATGVINGLKTTNDLRCGNASDTIRIPIYEAERESAGCRAAYETLSYDITITGEEVSAFVPQGTEINLTIKYISDGQRKLLVYIPTIDCEIEKDLLADRASGDNYDYVAKEISKAKHSIENLRKNGESIEELENEILAVEKENQERGEGALSHLRAVLRKIDKCDNEGAWDRAERKLRNAFDMLERDNEKYGNKEISAVNQLRRQVDDCICRKDLHLADELLEEMHLLNFKIATREYFEVWMYGWQKDFNSIRWKDAHRARMLLNQGLEMINNSESTDQIAPLIKEIIELLPNGAVPAGADGILTA